MTHTLIISVNPFAELCEYLTECLDTWLKNILERKIKLGKLCQNVKLDMEPADYVKEYQVINFTILSD